MTYRHLIIRFLCCATVFSAILCADHGAHAAIQPVSQQQTPDHYTRLQMFYQMETLTGIPWYYLAAIDQFERSIQGVRKDKQKTEGLIAIQIPSRLWHGAFNPDRGTSHMLAIHLFNGMGRDGDGDLIADPKNDRDVLYTMASYIRRYGITEDHIRIALWEYYKRDKNRLHHHRIRQYLSSFRHAEARPQRFPAAPSLQLQLSQHMGVCPRLGRTPHARRHRHIRRLRHSCSQHRLRDCGRKGMEQIWGMADRDSRFG